MVLGHISLILFVLIFPGGDTGVPDGTGSYISDILWTSRRSYTTGWRCFSYKCGVNN